MNKREGPTVKRAIAYSGRAGEEATAAFPPTIHRILIATVRYLHQCQVASSSGWTELVAQHQPSPLSLSQTVLVRPDDTDSIPLGSSGVDVDALRQGNPPQRRQAQSAANATPAASPDLGA